MLHWSKPGLWIIVHQINQSICFKIPWLGGGWWSSYRNLMIIVNKHLINKFLIELNFMSFLLGVGEGERGLKRTGRHQMPVWRWRSWAMGSHSRERNVRTRGLGMKKAIKKLANLFFLQSDRRKQTPPPPRPSNETFLWDSRGNNLSPCLAREGVPHAERDGLDERGWVSLGRTIFGWVNKNSLGRTAVYKTMNEIGLGELGIGRESMYPETAPPLPRDRGIGMLWVLCAWPVAGTWHVFTERVNRNGPSKPLLTGRK